MTGFRQKDGIISIKEDEAEIVRRIYREFLDCYSYMEIANHLNQEKIPTRLGGKEWTNTQIRNILTNEKYAGDCLFQKTFVSDPIRHIHTRNTGQVTQYYLEDCYPAIVDKNDWRVVQLMIKQLNGKQPTDSNPFAGMLYCSSCGKPHRIFDYRGEGYERVRKAIV